MSIYHFTNKIKSLNSTVIIRPNIKLIYGFNLTRFGLHCPTIADRITEILENKRSRKYKYCYDTVDNIQYLYDLDLFRKHKTQDLKLVSKKLIIQKRLKRSYEIGCITLQEYKKQIAKVK